MNPAALADRLVLIAEPGPEVLCGLVLLTIGLGGATLGAMLAWRGQIAALWLVGLFGLLVLFDAVALAHVPTRLVLDRDGIDLAIGPYREHRRWQDVGSVNLRRSPLGLWLSFTDAARSPRALPRPVQLFLGPIEIEPRLVEMRIEAWRHSAPR